MAWRLEPGEDLAPAFRRVAEEELAKIRARLTEGASRARGVHEARQGFKRLRALLRLAGSFPEDQKLYRDAGRRLAGSRNQTVLLESFDKMVAGSGLPREDLNILRAHLTANGGEVGGEDTEAGVRDVLIQLEDASARMAALPWPGDADALAKALKRSQARLKKAWKTARKSDDPHALHEWRKRVKDQAAQLRLLRRVASPSLRARHADEKKVAEMLGEEHDYWMLTERLEAAGFPDHTLATRDLILAATALRRDRLRKDAFKCGKSFSSQKPKAFARELTAAWVKASKRARRKSSSAETRATSPQP
jgi:hypothetical protein